MRFLQPLKASFGILVILFEIVKDVILQQLENAYSPNVVTELGMAISVILWQFVNALFPIVTSEFDIVTDVILLYLPLLSQKTPLPRLSVQSPISTPFMLYEEISEFFKIVLLLHSIVIVSFSTV